MEKIFATKKLLSGQPLLEASSSDSLVQLAVKLTIALSTQLPSFFFFFACFWFLNGPRDLGNVPSGLRS